MKKVLPLLILASTCLASCGESSIYGKYQFLLGRQGDDETRVSIEMDLKDEASAIDPTCKNFTAAFELSGTALSGQGGALGTFLPIIQSILNPDADPSADNGKDMKLSLPGYYKVSNLEVPKYGNKVKIAFDLGETINNFIKNVLEFEPADLISKFVVSYCNSSSFTLQIPISLDDIQMQLAWYGVYVDYDPYLHDKVNTINDLVDLALEGKLDFDSIKIYDLTDFGDGKLPGEQDAEVRYGTHPQIVKDGDRVTKDEVAEMNEKYVAAFSNTFVYKKDADDVLVKIGSVFEDLKQQGHYYFYPLNDYDPTGVTSINAVMKKDSGSFEYDFSDPVDVAINLVQPAFDNGSYAFSIDYKTPGETWDWDSFYKKPFTFRDFHDIKIELKKE